MQKSSVKDQKGVTSSPGLLQFLCIENHICIICENNGCSDMLDLVCFNLVEYLVKELLLSKLHLQSHVCSLPASKEVQPDYIHIFDEVDSLQLML